MISYVNHLYVFDAHLPKNGVVLHTDNIEAFLSELCQYVKKAREEKDTFAPKRGLTNKRFTLAAPLPGPFHAYFVNNGYPDLKFCAIMHGRESLLYMTERALIYHIKRQTGVNLSTQLFEKKQFVPEYPFTFEEVVTHSLPITVDIQHHVREDYATRHFIVGQDNYT